MCICEASTLQVISSAVVPLPSLVSTYALGFLSALAVFADVLCALRHALRVGSVRPLAQNTPLFLPPAAHAKLVCQTCSLLLTFKGLPKAFGGPQDGASRQLLPLSVAADVAASQTGADSESFRDTLTGTELEKLRRPKGLHYLYMPQSEQLYMFQCQRKSNSFSSTGRWPPTAIHRKCGCS